MNNKQKKLLQLILYSSIKGNIEWKNIESLLVALNCNILEGNGSQVKFIKNDIHLSIHRPHPSKESLNYRVKLAKDFLIKTGAENEI
jgi:hypothetical protein